MTLSTQNNVTLAWNGHKVVGEGDPTEMILSSKNVKLWYTLWHRHQDFKTYNNLLPTYQRYIEIGIHYGIIKS